MQSGFSSARCGPGHRDRLSIWEISGYFLDSEADYKDPNNLAVFIAYEHARAFKDAGIADPTAHFDGKTIDVTGAVVKQANQTRIRVTEPKQIAIVAEKAKASP